MQAANAQLIIQPLTQPALIAKTHTLNNTGLVKQHNDYTFLKIDDDFIHALYPDLGPLEDLQKPDYFTNEGAGAHITIIYPEENVTLGSGDLGHLHTFKVKSFCKAILSATEYFMLLVESDSLTELREKYALPAKPKYKQQRIDFHITIGRRC